MKGVIFLSGLAGLVLFGPPIWRHRTHTHHEVHVSVHQAEPSHSSWNGQDRCRFEAERSFSTSASSVESLWVKAGSGLLEIVGVEGLGEIRAVGRACASHEEFLDDLLLISDLNGSNLSVEARYPAQRGWSGGNRYARLDLVIEVPQGLDAGIEDGSGEITVSDLGSVGIKDGSGEVLASRINGDLTIEDGSGEVEASGVSGSVSIHDGSGEIVLMGVGADVLIHDSSGEMEISGVGGSVTIHDGSGEMEIQDIAGSVRVVGDSSGDIAVNGVGGDFVVEADGSGGITYSEVEGTVDIPKKKRGR